MTVTVSPARPEDYPRWRELFAGYAEFYEVELTEADVERAWSWIHDPDRSTRCLIARTEDGTPVGLAHYRAEDSPLSGTRGFLDDLFVDPAHRGGGVVDALLDELRRVAVAQGWPSVRWRTAEDNYRARAAYDRHAVRTPFLTYAMDAR
ncbi:GNAT family N-acetyltransferase [Allostreptomyces psammosilenae]|uniref:Ribosomal protein S18 acetylase RimI-like enzyme n=1 Tax=Allostreptomyces psammosilenae TaxID=1892865 RepID=A0A853A2A5_9ACTN|nr:GNAT family N-acetyltransferase [Allostreptomyces psammosilenae]NYI08247.1 ribosomal protein S18 acetylase RimI-like enzyme [Allostreptomyces psammosilenae]